MEVLDDSHLLLSRHDAHSHLEAQIRHLTDTRTDLLEALDGLAWQQDRKQAELAVAQEQCRDLAAERAQHLYTPVYDESPVEQLHHNRIMADTVMAQLHVAAIQKQVDYLDRQIARMRVKLAGIDEEIAEQRTGLRYRRGVAV